MTDPTEPTVQTVRLYNQILIWPLQLKKKAFQNDGVDKWARTIVDGSQGAWNRVPDLYERGYGQEAARYAEFAYFHPFVRDILFAKRDDGRCHVALLNRTDVKGVTVQLYPKHTAVSFEVRRVHLYLFETRTAVLVVETFYERALPLQDAEDLLDTFRRAYTPYFAKEEPHKPRAHCPYRVQWCGEADKPVGGSSDYEQHDELVSFVRDNREAPMARHWRDLLSPLTPWRGENDKAALAVRQLHDERIPTMALLAFDDPFSLSDGDWIRLCYLDERGDSSTLPYSKANCEGFKAEICYDRFWDPVAPAPRWMSTRCLSAGYSFVMVGKYEHWQDEQDRRCPGFFVDDTSGALMHFRHHYFQLGLVLFMQYASLMGFWDRLSEARETKKAVGLQRDFARFTSRFWFTELSSHLQARELHELWSRHLGVKDLYEEVHREIQFVGETLRSFEADRLNRIVGFIAPLALVTGIFGMNVVFARWDLWERLKVAFGFGPEFGLEIGIVIVFGLIVWLITWLVWRRP